MDLKRLRKMKIVRGGIVEGAGARDVRRIRKNDRPSGNRAELKGDGRSARKSNNSITT
jgi:hypothetical protein